MFHKVKDVYALDDCVLFIQFAEGVSKKYDVKPLMKKWKPFARLKDDILFSAVVVSPGGYGIIWDEELDLSCDELYYNGSAVKTSFDGLLAFRDATDIWGLNESTLRKAIVYGKLVNGVDVCKFGKQWLITRDAMEREYGKISE